MEPTYQSILNPVGNKAARQVTRPANEKRRGDGCIGLLNNSKPNVSFFLEAIEKEIRFQGKRYETVNITKPRSAAPYPEIDTAVNRCDFVINAVAD